MKLKIEFTDISKTALVKHAIHLCKKFQSYKTQQADGYITHSVEFESKEFKSVQAIKELTDGIKGVSYFCDGQLITGRDMYQIIWDQRNLELKKDRRPKQRNQFLNALLPEIIYKKKNFRPEDNQN